MAIKAYTGRMGGGKSYEVVSSVIVPALGRGRRVVSNIAGLNYPAMVDYLVAQGVEESKIGELVVVEHADIEKPDFWLTEAKFTDGVACIIQPGDLIALDEIWRFWDGFASRKMPDDVMIFFRMHRHFTHLETGVACDIALITQDIMDMARRVRSVVAETYVMTKLTMVGKPNQYRVSVFSGGKASGKPLNDFYRTYQSEIFPLYSSHSLKKEGAADAVEESVDSRGNIFQGRFFKLVIPLAVVFFLISVYMVWGFFHPTPKKTEAPKNDALPSSGAAAAAPLPAPIPASPSAAGSSEWRLVGYYGGSPMLRVVLSDGLRFRLLVNPSGFTQMGLYTRVELPEGGFATGFGGQPLADMRGPR